MTVMAQTLVDSIYYNLDCSTMTAEVTYGAKYKEDIVIPGNIIFDGMNYSVKAIGDSAFYECSGLTSISIPTSVTSIGNDAFGECDNLINIILPNSLTSIGTFTFYGCSNLRSIEIPSSVKSIGKSAFRNSALTRITMKSSTPPSINGNIFSNTNLKTIYIPNGTYESYNISPWSSYDIVEGELAKVDGIYYIINTLNHTAEVTQTIGGIFELYSDSIVIPTSISIDEKEYAVTSIGDYAFNIDSSILLPNTKLTNVKIPNGITYIGKCAFTKCTGLIELTIPNSVTYIGPGAFSGCTNLKKINIPTSVESLGGSAFADCTSLKNIEIPNSVTYIGPKAFYGCTNLKKINIPNKITLIESSTFQDCDSLTNIQIPKSVSSIKDSAFEGCISLVSIELPYTYIGYEAFYGCKNLISITITSKFPGPTSSSLFTNCNKLKTIYVPIGSANAYEIAPWNEYNIIELEEAKISPILVDNLYYNVDIENRTAEVVADLNSNKYRGDVVIPISISINDIKCVVSSIGDYAFAECTDLTSLTMQAVTPPATGSEIFKKCDNLETIFVPTGAKEAYNVAPWNQYNIVEELNYEPRHNGTKTRNDRPVTAVKLIGESSGNHVYTLTSAERNKDYTDVTASVVFQVEPGEKLTPKVEHDASWMNHAVYIDTDKNGFTGAIAAGSEWKPAGDLVSYSFYNNGSASDASGWNSVGEVISGHNRMNPPLPAFTAPTEPGIYRMRFVQDWCSIDPAGDNDGKYGDFKDNGGQIVDVMLEVLNHVYLTDGEDYTNATEQETERITYTREFKNTEWQAWYVPFDIDYDAISEDFTAASLNAVHQYDDDDDGVFERWTLEILKLKSGEVLRANMPYMIRAKETGEHNFVVENAILYPAEENSLDCSSVRVHYTFKGNYSLMDGQVLRDNGWFAPGGGSLVTPTVGSNLKAYRWLLMPEARSGYGTFYAPKRINIVIGDEEGEVTGIEEVTQEEWPADVYDLNGRMVKAQAENLDELPKGVYIVNGKKFVK